MVNTALKEIGAIIREKRKKSELDQATTATLAGIGVNTLIRIEHGEGNPSFEVLHKVLTTLGLTLKIE